MAPKQFSADLLLSRHSSVYENISFIELAMPSTSRFTVSTITGMVFGITSVFLAIYAILQSTDRFRFGLRRRVRAEAGQEEFELEDIADHVNQQGVLGDEDDASQETADLEQSVGEGES